MNIVFDFGGVLLRWQPQEFIQRLLPRQVPDADAARVLVASFFEGFGGDWGEFDRGTIAREPLAERIAQRTGLALAEVNAVIDAVPHELQPIEPMVALLRRLHERGHALYFLSNMPAAYADHLDATLAFIGLFRAGVYSARVRMIKPEAAIFAHAAAAFGIEAADTLFIDDVLRNAEAARAAGWQALHFRDPAQCEAELARRGLL
ncbi:MAG: HAD family phosphatase [Burkholderiales bacterium]|nr:HAD family phosphatase [Burkholderiales bacterium]